MKPQQMTIYISGKITGEPAHQCTRKFKVIQQQLEKMGHVAINPLELGVTDDMNWHQAMKHCIKHLMTADAVFMINDYLNSRGAVLEVQISRALDMPTFTDFKEVKRCKPRLKMTAK